MLSSNIRPESYHNGVEIRVQGIVQGVGFRPFIFTLATRFGVAGSVTNTSTGVYIKARADEEALRGFIEAICAEAPPLAKIHELTWEELPEPLAADSFTISASSGGESASAIIPPDIALCEDCRRELIDPADRRYRYPFINCTNCGPRFSIVKTIPYDRPKTSMEVFPMCEQCLSEYENPADRRFHAQPNACKRCGPSLSWHDGTGEKIVVDDVIDSGVAALKDRKIIALRGLGGFHLCADGCSEQAVATLRHRKHRPHKPLAIMVADLEAAARLCRLSQEEAATLQGPEHPIALLKPLPDSVLAANLAPAMNDIGVMLPYTPLHHLLFAHPDCPPALVMTSGNMSGEPICTSIADAIARLSPIADNFLLHNRDIVTRVDDSVVKKMAGATRLLRRARGYVPSPLLVPYELPDIIGCGGGLKSTFSLARGKTIFPSQHIGDLFNQASFDFYLESIDNLKRLLRIEPAVAACDLHPDYLSTRHAESIGLPLYHIQHHHAHAVAVMAEHGITEPVLAVVLDGTGFGPDATIWGGEILRVGLTDYTRLGALETTVLPGGEKAAEEPWRMALAYLHVLRGNHAADSDLLAGIDRDSRRAIVEMIEKEINCPRNTSCGRLFDAVAALLGLNLRASFEGQAAMQLEACAEPVVAGERLARLLSEAAESAGDFILTDEEISRIRSTDMVERVVEGLTSGVDRATIAAGFHIDLISAISHLVAELGATHQLKQVVLTGGCLQNRIIMEGLFFTLGERGFTVHSGTSIPVNDGGISIGQAVIGGLRYVSGSAHAG